jgi:hypothetical protein
MLNPACRDTMRENDEIEAVDPQFVRREEHFNTNFFATAASLNVHGSTVSIDFLCHAPRSSHLGPAEVVEHNTVIMDIHHAKRFAQLFNQWIGELEGHFGTIDNPEFVKNFESKAPGREKQPPHRPNYLG